MSDATDREARQALGRILREWRKDVGLRQTTISGATGIGEKSLSSFETGERSPDAHQLIRILRALGKEPRDIAAEFKLIGLRMLLVAHVPLANLADVEEYVR